MIKNGGSNTVDNILLLCKRINLRRNQLVNNIFNTCILNFQMALNASEIDELISALLENKNIIFLYRFSKETTEVNSVQVKNMLSIFHSLSIVHEVIDYLHDDWEDLTRHLRRLYPTF